MNGQGVEPLMRSIESMVIEVAQMGGLNGELTNATISEGLVRDVSDIGIEQWNGQGLDSKSGSANHSAQLR